MRPCGFMPPGRFCVLMGLLRVMLARSHSPVPLPAAFVSVTRQPTTETEVNMAIINLRDYYPFYTSDYFMEVSEEVAEMFKEFDRICIVFAQLERETIQKRVTDAYYSRCLKGFHMSGQAPYGYQLEPTVVEGIRTKKMVADPVAADHVRLMFEMYAEPETSFGDITRYFEEQGIKIYEKSMVRSFLSQLLRNPVYAQADLELYEFFKSQGAAIVNDASDFAGTNGCYL